ncbi:hypothetical protein Lfu02_32820 [Longispora fulva]|nr:hypothetical protein Lfu02_32820 [Longispora fulva]
MVVALIGLFAATLGLWNWSVTSGLRDRGVETTGVSVEGPRTRQGGQTWVLEYSDPRGELVRCGRVDGVPPGAGKGWRIRYDPQRPTRCAFSNDPLPLGGQVTLTVAGLLVLLAGLGWIVVWLLPDPGRVARAAGGSRKGR